MEYKELKLPKGAAAAIFGGLNDNMNKKAPKKVASKKIKKTVPNKSK